jgi:phosphatidylserine/phosphatidylglycerophosphate/cardiolipin synthase-like enzyme
MSEYTPPKMLIGRDFPREVTPLINKAKKSISIVVFDWGWYPEEIGEKIQIFNQAIVRAQRRNVAVKALVNKRLIRTILENVGIEAKQINSTKLLHTKLMIIDSEVAILGSHNYTKNAFNINFEASIMVYDKEFIEKAENYFENISL